MGEEVVVRERASEEIRMCVAAHLTHSVRYMIRPICLRSHLAAAISSYIAALEKQGRKYVKEFINSLLADEKWDSFRVSCSN